MQTVRLCPPICWMRSCRGKSPVTCIITYPQVILMYPKSKDHCSFVQGMLLFCKRQGLLWMWDKAWRNWGRWTPEQKDIQVFPVWMYSTDWKLGLCHIFIGTQELAASEKFVFGSGLKRGWGWGELQGPAKVEPSTWGHEVNIENRVRNLPRTSVKQPNHHEGAESAASLWLESQPQTRQVVLKDVG